MQVVLKMSLLVLLMVGLPVIMQAQRLPPRGPWLLSERKWRRVYDLWSETHPQDSLELLAKPVLAPWNVSPDSILLFLNCENHLLLPRLKKGQAPVWFSATGATLRVDVKAGQLHLDPKAKVVVLRAMLGKKELFKHQFQAVLPPPPKIEIYLSAYPTRHSPIEDTCCRKFDRLWIVLKAIPDEYFADVMREDARYRTAQSQCQYLRSGVAIMPSEVVCGPQGELRKVPEYVLSQDQLCVTVQSVHRQNYKGMITLMPVTKEFMVPASWFDRHGQR